jgi:hypothetical protein
MHKSSVSPVFAKQIMPLLFVLYNNYSVVAWTIISFTAAKFKLRMFSVWLRLILMSLYDLSFLPAQYNYTIVYMLKVESVHHKFPGEASISHYWSNQSYMEG